MRIAYVSLHWPRTRGSGVGKKILSQIAAWRAARHEVELFMHVPASAIRDDLLPARLFPYADRGRVTTESSRARAAGALVSAVRRFQPDLIYLRYGIYVFPVHRLSSVAPMVEEINTNDLKQHEGLGPAYAFYNRLTRGVLLRRVAGLISASQELAESPNFAVYRKPTRTIANGIDLQEYEALPPPWNEIPRLAFIGSPRQPWHGVDKLVELVRRYPDIHLDIIGYDSAGETGPLPANITLHGFLAKEAYTRVLASADAAVSSLALHRIGLTEASPLKSRECLALGLPLIMAYRDTDLHGLDCDFLQTIPNNEDNIRTHGHKIRDFAFDMRGRRVDRRVIAPIDQRVKEQDRLAFFEHIARGTTR